MKNINEIVPFVEEQEIFVMPQVRIIGKECRQKHNADYNPFPAFWDELLKNGFPSELEKLPRAILKAMLGWTGNSDEEAFSYIASIICPVDTPVQKGYVYRDLPASYVAKGEYCDDISKSSHQRVSSLVTPN